MIRSTTIAALSLFAASPAIAAAPDSPVPSGPEARILNIAGFLEWVADGSRGVYIRSDRGKWYYARTLNECSRLRSANGLGFLSKTGDLDRHDSLRVQGWRCRLTSVVESGPPPSLQGS
ncbi:MAG TPA: hypothetical protein VIT45_04655 [Allosphingosinicella sp.]